MAARCAGGTHKQWLIDVMEAIDEANIRGQSRRLAIWAAMQSFLGACSLDTPVDNTREVLTVHASVVNFIRETGLSSIGHLRESLQKLGHSDIARRLSKATRGRNIAAHLEIAVIGDIRRALGSGESSNIVDAMSVEPQVLIPCRSDSNTGAAGGFINSGIHSGIDNGSGTDSLAPRVSFDFTSVDPHAAQGPKRDISGVVKPVEHTARRADGSEQDAGNTLAAAISALQARSSRALSASGEATQQRGLFGGLFLPQPG